MNIQDLRALQPCYDPIRYFSEDWQGSITDVLRMEQIPAEDRIWVAARTPEISDQVKEAFIRWCSPKARFTESSASQFIVTASNATARAISWHVRQNVDPMGFESACRVAQTASRKGQINKIIELIEEEA